MVIKIMEYYVAKTGNDNACGSKEQPFLTISRAAEVAVAGDTVTVHAGVYREWVSPANGGREAVRPSSAWGTRQRRRPRSARPREAPAPP